MARIGKLVIVGVGLIGGSFALALKGAGAVGRAVGVGRGAGNIRRAMELGIIDAIGAADEATFGDADLALLAVPVGQMQRVMRAVAPLLGEKTVVTDAGSTKEDVVAIALVRTAWESCGASVSEMRAREHDAVLAAVSHLPHVLAYALVDQVARHKNAKQLFSFAAGGFRDFTRIASSHPEMWRDICLANRKALLVELRRYGGGLERVKRMLARGDARALEALFSGARAARDRWLTDDNRDGE